MKTIYLTLLFVLINSVYCIGQHFVSDSVCYKNKFTLEIIKCDTSDHWEIDRNGDFIQTKHWLNKHIALMNSLRIQNKMDEESGYLDTGIRSSTQLFTCIATDNVKTFYLSVIWQYMDFDDDEKWDQLRFYWIEDRTTMIRIIYCHEE